MARYTSEDIEKRYQDLTCSARVKIKFKSSFVGGQPGQRPGVEAFVIHQLHLGVEDPENSTPKTKAWKLTPEGEVAVMRIVGEELGEKSVTPPEGEVAEKVSYAVNVLRWSPFGPWIGDWMIKACMKQALSRVGLFVKRKGSKGDVAEAGRAVAIGESLRDPAYPQYIHLILPDGKRWEDRVWDRIFGRVHTPQGAKSIVTDCEVAPAGTMAEFEWRWYAGKLTEDDVLSALALAGNCGLGSARSLERGKFEIVEAEITTKKPKKDKADDGEDAGDDEKEPKKKKGKKGKKGAVVGAVVMVDGEDGFRD
jgi:hypothetical protein